ncbi:MAG: DUF72 domain-containing protein [Deltaproteobacteria bacterium]|nr:DUF72 domain-containing protein [Deltaproteobacteria bacterium]
MARTELFEPSGFYFRGLHPRIFMGTASDRYAGWIGQVYSRDRYDKRISRRSRKLGGRTYVEETLPVDSVEEYFEHFRSLELDFTFYPLLLEEDGEPSQNFHVLDRYSQHLKEEDYLILKVPKVLFAQKILQHGTFVENGLYLDAETFRRRFYEPAVELLGSRLRGLVFEQEYQRKQDRVSPDEVADSLDRFFAAIPKDDRYHVELRTEAYLSSSVFKVLESHGIGQVLSHWTWLPPLTKQLELSGNRFLNAAGDCIVRLMTPKGVRYEQAYAEAHPFNALVDGMLDPNMVSDTVRIMDAGVRREVDVHVIVNNRAGGNAPLIAKLLAEEFVHMRAAPAR